MQPDQIARLLQLRQSPQFQDLINLGTQFVDQARNALETAESLDKMRLQQGVIAGIRMLFDVMDRLEMIRDGVEDAEDRPPTRPNRSGERP